MTNLKQLQIKVKAKSEELFLPRLFDALKSVHKKRYYKVCDCSYCKLKRGAIENINGGYYHSLYSRDLAIIKYRKRLNDVSNYPTAKPYKPAY